MTVSCLRVALIGGDGIGPDVVAEGVKVETTDYDLGARRWRETGEALPDAVLDELRGHDVILLGAVGDVSVAVECNGERVTARGVSTDVVEASARAFLHALNKVVSGTAVHHRTDKP